MDLRAVRDGLRIAAFGAVALFVFLFFFDWYGIGGEIGAFAERAGISATVNGWHGHSILRWLMLLTIIGALGLTFMAATGRKLSWPIAPSAILTALSGLTTILVAYRLILNNPGPDSIIDTKVGAWLGLLSLVTITVGGYFAMREDGVSFKDAGGQARAAMEGLTKPDVAANSAPAAAPAADVPPTEGPPSPTA
ncbi:MAG TPA: hypothetical protein VGI67_14100 [Thermoleophilaceae bacterium]|jgi:hypothetical protein